MLGTLLAVAGQLRVAHAEDRSLAAHAQAILKANCHACHGKDGSAKGGFGYVLDRDRLVAGNKIVPGETAESELFRRIQKGEMPPRGRSQRPTADELGVLKQWIEAGAPAAVGATQPRTPVSEQLILRIILDDLKTVSERQRRFLRYLTLAHGHNAGRSDDELTTVRQAVAKLVNSLSLHPRITPPRAIDAAHTILRIDLRDYKWSARTWERLVSVYPYRIPEGSAAARACVAATGSEAPVLRADWFVATAARPPLYYDLLQLPGSDRELERQLHVEALTDIQEESVLRAGFNGSGVSRNNRLIERHDADHGAYWRSYDFSDNTGRQNLFEHPLGPLTGETSFQPAGGEIIFHLPNGLFGYLLVDRDGRRVERAPIEIVSDPKRPDRVVEAGLSCMSCHARGLIPKGDQVRAHVEKNRNAFRRADVETVRALYPPEAKLKSRIDEDNERYLRALTKTGAHTAETDPVMTTALRYEDTLDLPAAAAETGLTPEEFTSRLGRAPGLARTLGPLKDRAGRVQRDVFVAAFPDLIRDFQLGKDGKGAVVAEPTLEADRSFVGHTGAILSLAFSPNGEFALSGSADRTLRLWYVETGKELRRFVGHTDEVSAVAFSPGGQFALSGSADRTLRLWNLATGREVYRLTGHTDRVQCVAFSADARLAVSCGQDHMVRVWDLTTGKELRSLSGHSAWVSGVAFSPNGRRILSVSHDQTVRLWDTESGRELNRLPGPSRELYSVAFSPDGRLAVAGGNDRTVHLWDLETGKEIRRFEGHRNAVIQVAFSADGKRVLSGSSQYRQADQVLRVWDLPTGRELRALSGGDAERVSSVAFSADGRLALSGNPQDHSLRLWKLAE
jgi:mono/diheme cytochrome c family protein